MTESVEGESSSLKRKAGNPVFQDWLEELLDEAKVKKSKLEPMLQEALTSLSNYPLPLHTGADCAILQGFNKKLCAFLDKRLEVYSSRDGEQSQSSSSIANSEPISSQNSVNGSPKNSQNENTSETNNSGTLRSQRTCSDVVVDEEMPIIAEPLRAIGEETLVLPPGSFNIIMLVDNQRTGGYNKVFKKNSLLLSQFKFPGFKTEYRSLKVGDFIWIARHKIHKEQELVLPYIVERKKMDDLRTSINDGRFYEQKLRKCGLKNVYYLVENYGSYKQVGLTLQSLNQALANTRIQDDFKVHLTDSLSGSVLFLGIMMRELTFQFKDKTLVGGNIDVEGEELMTFKYFDKPSMKNRPLTVKDTFIKLLLLLKGVSVEKALAITRMFPTPKLLITEYDKYSEEEGETLLANIKCGDMNFNVGPTASRSIYRFFCTQNTS